MILGVSRSSDHLRLSSGLTDSIVASTERRVKDKGDE